MIWGVQMLPSRNANCCPASYGSDYAALGSNVCYSSAKKLDNIAHEFA